MCETHGHAMGHAVMTTKTEAETRKRQALPRPTKIHNVANAANERVEAFTAAGVKDTGESWSLCDLGLEKFMHRQAAST